jgi:hypothetical protein
MELSPILILLKNDISHKEYNKTILNYLNDRFTYINDSGFYIKIDTINQQNIDDYTKIGVSSIPCIVQVKEDNTPEIENGVNNILSKLSKLEIKQTTPKKKKQESFYEMSMKEMLSEDQEDEPNSSSVIFKNQNIENPMSDKDIEDKRAIYDEIISQRQKNNKLQGKAYNKKNNIPNKKSLKQEIEKNNYDVGEKMFLSQVASNMDDSDSDY